MDIKQLNIFLNKRIQIEWLYTGGYNESYFKESSFTGILVAIDQEHNILHFDDEIIAWENLEKVISIKIVEEQKKEKKENYQVGDRVILGNGKEVTISHISKERTWFKYEGQKSETWDLIYKIQEKAI